MNDVRSGEGSRDREELCTKGLALIRDLTEAIVHGRGDPLRLANQIYWVAWEHGGWVGQPGEDAEAPPTCPDLADPGAEFLQLADALECHQDNADARDAYIALIRDAAEAFLAGRPTPEWQEPR